jgi:protein-disulfide isomerase
MFKVKVFGTIPPCAKCREMEKRAQNVAARFSDIEIAKLDALSEEGDRYGIMSTPTIVVNDKVVSIGKLITEEELEKIIKKEMEEIS